MSWALSFFTRDKVTFISALAVLAVAAGALAAPWIAPFAYDAQDTAATLQGPSGIHWLGTDRLGRDLYSRILYGARVSMTIGIATALTAVLIGTLYGAVSGYVGGRTDNLMMRLVDVIYPLPDLLLIILITILTGRGVLGIFLALSLVGWVTAARIVRGEVIRLRTYPFVEAAVSSGASHGRILFRHILPNTLAVLIVTTTFRIPASILAESTLSFVGLGIAPPAASWGSLANEGWAAMKFYPHLILFPSLAIFITTLAFNFLGDSLRDALDPEHRV